MTRVRIVVVVPLALSTVGGATAGILDTTWPSHFREGLAPLSGVGP